MRRINRQSLLLLTLLFGWMGSHKFYVGKDTVGPLYFVLSVLGIVFISYLHIRIPLYGFNIGYVFLAIPFAISLIEFILLYKTSDAEFHNTYDRPADPLALIFLSQCLFLLLIFTPLVVRLFAGSE